MTDQLFEYEIRTTEGELISGNNSWSDVCDYHDRQRGRHQYYYVYDTVADETMLINGDEWL